MITKSTIIDEDTRAGDFDIKAVCAKIAPMVLTPKQNEWRKKHTKDLLKIPCDVSFFSN